MEKVEEYNSKAVMCIAA